MLKTLVLSVLCLAGCEICTAGSLFVTGSGMFSNTDTADAYVTPGDTFSLQFVVPTSPTTNGSNSTTVSFDVPVAGFTYKLDGIADPVSPPTEITFYTDADGGGYEVDFDASTEFLFGSSQIFSGTTAAPVFSPGTFGDQNFLFLDNNNVDSNSATVIVGPTPEPSSILLLLCGGIVLVAVGIRKSARIAG